MYYFILIFYECFIGSLLRERESGGGVVHCARINKSRDSYNVFLRSFFGSQSLCFYVKKFRARHRKQRRAIQLIY